MKTMVCGIMRDLDAECAAYERRALNIRLASASLARDEIARICARHELESDEFQTRAQKAREYL